jgi:cytochrome P450
MERLGDSTNVDSSGYLALDPATVIDPYPLYEALRRQGAPAQESTYGVWLVTRYADILDVVRRPLEFSSSAAPTGPPIDHACLRPDVAAQLRSAAQPLHTLVTADPPDHSRYRTLVNRFVNARRAQAWEPRIRQIADELVDGFENSGRCELIEDFAGPLPLRVVAELLGMPDADHADLRRWADEAADGIGNPGVVIERLQQPAHAPTGIGFAEYFSARVTACRRLPADDGDLVSQLVHARTDDGRLLDDPELLSILGHFLVAGHETSTKMIAAGMRLLLEHPDQMALVRSDASLCAGLVEEALRFDAPVQGMFRVAVVDADVAGVHLPAGSMLMLLYGSGNRDEIQFPDARRFDVRRANARTNLAFGQGIHYCSGAPFARAEGRIGFEVLLRRLADIRIAADHLPFEFPPSFILRGMKALHIEFSARSAPPVASATPPTTSSASTAPAQREPT